MKNAPLVTGKAGRIARIDAFLDAYHRGTVTSRDVLPMAVSEPQEVYSVLDSAQSSPVMVGAERDVINVFEGAITWEEMWRKGDILFDRYHVQEDVRGTFVRVVFDDFCQVNHTFHLMRRGRGIVYRLTTIHRWRTSTGSIRALLFGNLHAVAPSSPACFVAHDSKAYPGGLEAIRVVLQIEARDTARQLVAIFFVQMLGSDFLGYRAADLANNGGDLLRSPLLQREKATELLYLACPRDPHAYLGAYRARTQAVSLLDAYGATVEVTFLVEVLPDRD